MLINIILMSQGKLQTNLTCSISFIDFKQVISKWDKGGDKMTWKRRDNHQGSRENISINFLTLENLKKIRGNDDVLQGDT